MGVVHYEVYRHQVEQRKCWVLQKNSFFSQPLIFYGAHEVNEEEETNEDTWQFTDPWFIVPNANPAASQVPRIGLFIHWADTVDIE